MTYLISYQAIQINASAVYSIYLPYPLATKRPENIYVVAGLLLIIIAGIKIGRQLGHIYQSSFGAWGYGYLNELRLRRIISPLFQPLER